MALQAEAELKASMEHLETLQELARSRCPLETKGYSVVLAGLAYRSRPVRLDLAA